MRLGACESGDSMQRTIDLYTQTLSAPVPGVSEDIGVLYARYTVQRVNNLRNLTAQIAYRLTCTTRIVVNYDGVQPTYPSYMFSGYPARIDSQVLLTAASPDIRLVDYSPRTINTTTNAAASSSANGTTSSSLQQTNGSSVSQTNSYNYHVSASLFDLSASADEGHSKTRETSKSTNASQESSMSRESGESDSMSIKDWAAYSHLGEGLLKPAWIFAQEYPWDVLQYSTPAPGTSYVPLPQFVMDRMFYPVASQDYPILVAPPSHLSLFGPDVTMKAVWEIELPATLADQTISVQHLVNYTSASHGVVDQDGTRVQTMTLDSTSVPQATFESGPIDLTLLGLDPILSGDVSDGAVVGFIPSKFISPPATGQTFKILSDSNTLQVTGSGFDADMTAAPTSTSTPTVTVSFKILDSHTDYALFIKGWVGSEGACLLTFAFNGDADTAVTRRVDSLEGQGGENNLISVVMRNKDYTSIDYHDYLKPGFNTVEITITADGAAAAPPFVMRALAIGEG